MELNDRVIVITGGGAGIGEALAHAVSNAGARHVVVADLNAEAAARVAEAVGGTGVGIDVADEGAIRRLVAETERAHGPIGLFASNAGFVAEGGVEDTNERIEAMWQVHVMAHIYAARAVLPSMIAQGEGYLLNTASAAGLLSQIGSLSYTVTKHASVGLAEWLAITHHHQGIRVSVLCPQAVATDIITNSPDYDNRGQDDVSVAAADGVLTAERVAADCLAAVAEERFHVLPHSEVQTYVERKATDIDRWLDGMRRFQASMYLPGEFPGDAIA